MRSVLGGVQPLTLGCDLVHSSARNQGGCWNFPSWLRIPSGFWLTRTRVLFAKGMGADKVNAERMPWNVLDILFDGNLPALEMALLLKRLADHTGLASAFDLGP